MVCGEWETRQGGAAHLGEHVDIGGGRLADGDQLVSVEGGGGKQLVVQAVLHEHAKPRTLLIQGHGDGLC